MLFYRVGLWFLLQSVLTHGVWASSFSPRANVFMAENQRLYLPAIAAYPHSHATTYQAELHWLDSQWTVTHLAENTATLTASSVYDVSSGQLLIPTVVTTQGQFAVRLGLNTARDALNLLDIKPHPRPQQILAQGLNVQGVQLWTPARSQQARVLVSTTTGVYPFDVDGNSLGDALYPHHSGAMDIRYRVPFAGQWVALLAIADQEQQQVALLRLDPNTQESSLWANLPLNKKPEAICLYRSRKTNEHYLFTVTSQDMTQWQLNFRGESLNITPLITRPLTLAATACVVDDDYEQVYVGSDQGIFAYPAEPEAFASQMPQTVTAQTSVDLTLYYTNYGAGYLLSLTPDGEVIAVRRDDGVILNGFTVMEEETPDFTRKNQWAGLAVMPRGVAAARNEFAQGVIALWDRQADAVQLLSWGDVAEAMYWLVEPTTDPNLWNTSSQRAVLVRPTLQTQPVNVAGDAADDPAIWLHPTHPELSTLLGTQKQGGLFVYDLSGQVIQFLADGRLNNVDLRYGFPLGGERVDIVTATNRTDNSMGLYRVDPITRQLESIAAERVSIMLKEEVYGVCMYHDKTTDKYYVFVNEFGGLVQQWLLSDNGHGAIDTTLVRTFDVGSQTEGCVVDDYLGYLYIGEEDVAIWRYSAQPDAGTERVLIDQADGGFFSADVEGLALYYLNETEGYLIASSQGNNTYTVYERGGEHRYLGAFRIVNEERLGIDGVTNTDGIDVTNRPLGDAFPLGAFIAQDDVNTLPRAFQNFKVVSWEHIATRLNLQMNPAFKP
jgi:3-phytase